MKTYVVNLQKDEAKRLDMLSQLAVHPDLDSRIWTAVEGRRLSDAQQHELVSDGFFSRYGRNATLPAIGCALSHLSIYRDVIAQHLPYALVLEDDALLPNNLNLEPFIQWLDTEEPVVVLLTPDFWYRKRDVVAQLHPHHTLYSIKEGYMTSGYLINKTACRLLMSLQGPIQYVADDWQTFVSFGLHLFGIVPHLVSYPDGMGEIGRSQHHHRGFYEKCRALAVYFYIRLIWEIKYIRGYHRSLKKWK